MEIAFGPECRAKTEAFLGCLFTEMRRFHAQVYLKPSWEAWAMPDGRVAVICDKVATRLVTILPNMSDYWEMNRNKFADVWTRYKL